MCILHILINFKTILFLKYLYIHTYIHTYISNYLIYITFLVIVILNKDIDFYRNAYFAHIELLMKTYHLS